MSRLYQLVFCLLLCQACNERLSSIEIKNENDIIVEQYYINSDSLKTGISKTFDDEGKLFTSTNYLNGTIEGERIIYFPSGNMEAKENYIGGKLEGEYYAYHENGQIKQKAVYKNNVMEGLVSSYSEDGNLKEEVNFKNNQENGQFVEYYKNGNKKWEGNYLNGDNEFGLLSQFDSTGILMKKLMCDSIGMCQTIWTLEEGDIEIQFKL